MKKKVMLLLILLPILFMIAIYSVTKVVSITVDIPASGITITTQNQDGFIDLDMATYADDLYIKAEVTPANAKNRNYKISVSPVSDTDKFADVTVNDSDGKLLLQSTGKAKITVTTAEKGFTDSVIVTVDSSKLVDVVPYLETAVGESVALSPSATDDCDYVANIASGKYVFGSEIEPKNLSESTILFESADSRYIDINPVTGAAGVMLSGETYVTVVGKDGVKGDITKKIKLNVTPADDITVNGMSIAEAGLVFASGSQEATFIMESPNGAPTLTCADASFDYQEIAAGKYIVTVSFNSTVLERSQITVKVGATTKPLDVEFGAYDLSIATRYHYSKDAEDGMFQKTGTAVAYTADLTPFSSNVRYVWTSSDPSIFEISQNGSLATITAVSNGTATLGVKILSTNGAELYSEERTVTAVTPVRRINFTENKEYGIGKVLTLGNQAYKNGAVRPENPSLNIRIFETADATEGNKWDYARYNGNLIFTSSDTSIARVTTSKNNNDSLTLTYGKNFEIETVTINVAWAYNEYFNESATASLTLRAVNGGINVSDYEALRGATESGRPVVLLADIMLGTKTYDVNLLKTYVNTMVTTYDRTHYINNNSLTYTVMYALEFKNSIYGNGFELNADYITRATVSEEDTDVPLLYKGPLDFVTASGGGTSTSTAAVKAQDNISFLVRTPGVVIDNVVLKGCSDESIVEGGVMNLSLLNYVGTVLEVCSDTVIRNSRVSNGRTVLRVFGGGNGTDNPVLDSLDGYMAKDERINVTVESSILTTAREFIVKVGSNRAVRARSDTSGNPIIPKLTKSNGQPYDLNGNIPLDDSYFYDRYVTTDLTIKDSVLYTSGLFAIGVDTHFAGEMLHGVGLGATVKWHDLCATSLASVVRIEGDTRMLEWKNTNNVDSSTLIESTLPAESSYNFLKLDIRAMLTKVNEDDAYRGIVVNDGDNTYVHGGIACYGGGYNFSIVDFSKSTFAVPTKYSINLSALTKGEDTNSVLYSQGSVLPMAAGPGDFRFYMYNANSEFTMSSQQKLIDDEEAFIIKPSL